MMKTAHIFLPFMAALLLVPVASAQTPDHEKYSLNNGVATNKYVLNDVPNPDGTYTLRLETFITGEVSASAMPTDFVLVLDASGSMFYDYRPENLYPPMNDEVNATTWAKLWPYFVHEPAGKEYSSFSIYYTYKTGAVGSNGTGSPRSTSNAEASRSYYTHFRDEGVNHTASLFYHYVDGTSNDGYYKIFRRMFDQEDGCLLVGGENPSSDGTTATTKPWKKYAGIEHTGTPVTLEARPETVLYNLAIRLKDGTYKYLNGNGLSDERYDATGVSKIMFTNDGNIYRIKHRVEALLDGVESFVSLIAAENNKDQWADNIPAKHQVAIVRFSGAYATGGENDISVPSGKSVATHVLKGFTQVEDADEFISDFEDRYIISGSTYTDYGMHLARLLLEDLQQKDDGVYAAVNQSGGQMRNKVVVFFTDGEPSNHGETGNNSFFATVSRTLEEGKIVKKVGVNNINGRVYSIDLAMSASTKSFLEHLSSNYPKGDTDVTSGSYSASHFTGSKVPISEDDITFTETEYSFLKDDQPIFYKDSNDGDLTSVFSGIASANTGQQAGEKLVVMDVMSDSFKIPSDASGSIKLYTAQCIGTKEIEGETYLAFAQEVEVGSRDPLAHFWVSRVEGEGDDAVTVWEDLGAETSGGWDIDTGITVVPADDGKSITVGGFDYVSYWCGLDDVIGHHNNTRQISTSDPNYSAQLDGYRGFKLIIEFPIVVSENAIGGPKVFTNNKRQSGLYSSVDGTSTTGSPIATYESPYLMIPVRLEVQKDGLKPGESASFIVERREIADGSEWLPYTSFILTGVSGTELPSIKMFTLDPSYYYRIVENGWNWNYSNPATSYPSTENENLVTNPIVITNNYQDLDIKHAEAKAVNTMGTGSTTVYDEN